MPIIYPSGGAEQATGYTTLWCIYMYTHARANIHAHRQKKGLKGKIPKYYDLLSLESEIISDIYLFVYFFVCLLNFTIFQQ